MKAKIRKFQLWTYDVWGNSREGFDVNDRYKQGIVSIACRRAVFNAGTAQEFETFEPTDRQLSRAVGGRGLIWDGQEGAFYAENARSGRPVCELIEVIE